MKQMMNTAEPKNDKSLELAKIDLLLGMLPGVFHEMNNQLAAISGYTELLLDSAEKTSQEASDLINIKDAGDKCIEMTAAMTELTKPEGDAESSWMFDTDRSVGEALSLLQKPLRARNIGITFIKSVNPPMAMGRKGNFMFAFTFVLFNLVEKLPRGARLIVERGEKRHGAIHISIKIAESGFPELRSPQFFRKTSEWMHSPSDMKDICRETLKRMGGRLLIHPDSEDNSEYEFELISAVVDEPEKEVAACR